MAGSQTDFRIALLGNRGTGKSSSGNTILGRDWFRENLLPRAVTQTCERKIGAVNGKTVLVIDTPGLFDTSLTEEQLEVQMENCARMSDPGLHAFLLVIRLDVGFTERERNIMRHIQRYFGNDASRYTIVLLTHADHLNNEPLEEFIMESHDLQVLIESCEGRYHSFNNRDKDNRQQVTKLLEKIKEMVEINTGHHPTSENFKTTQSLRIIKRNGLFVGALGAAFGFGCGFGALAAVFALKQLQ